MGHGAESKILKEYRRRFAAQGFFESLEHLLTSPDGFGLESATPLQRAVCRITEGRDLAELADDPVVLKALGGQLPHKLTPSEIVIVAGVRTGKSMFGAAVAIWSSQVVNIDHLADGEIPRFSVLSLRKDNARVVLAHLLGALQKPALNCLVVKNPGKWKALIDETGSDVIGSFFLWHPSKRPVEIRVVAGERAGGSLVSRWSFGGVLDEAPRMLGATEGVINYDDARDALLARLLPGAKLVSIGSPWQPYGPIYDMVQSEWGNPVHGRTIIKAPGPDLNPYWWNTERCEQMRNDPKSQRAYRTDVLAEFADEEEALFPHEVIVASTRREPATIPYEPRHEYVAAMDPAARANAWTLVVCDRQGAKKRVVLATQWQGTSHNPLRPSEVLDEVKEILASYNLNWCLSDQWSAEAIRDLALEKNFYIQIEDWTTQNKTNAYLSLAAQMADGLIEVPLNTDLTKDLKLVKKVPNSRGVSIKLAKSTDGRHCDYVPAMALAMHRWIEDEQKLPPSKDSKEYWDQWEAEQIENEVAELESQTEWWADLPYQEPH